MGKYVYDTALLKFLFCKKRNPKRFIVQALALLVFGLFTTSVLTALNAGLAG